MAKTRIVAKPKIEVVEVRTEEEAIAGHGLGLSLAAAIAVLYDGTIELHDNHPGLKVVISLGSSQDFKAELNILPTVLPLSPMVLQLVCDGWKTGCPLRSQDGP